MGCIVVRCPPEKIEIFKLTLDYLGFNSKFVNTYSTVYYFYCYYPTPNQDYLENRERIVTLSKVFKEVSGKTGEKVTQVSFEVFMKMDRKLFFAMI